MMTKMWPLSGVSLGDQMRFHGISQRAHFPAYLTSDYSQVFAQAHTDHPYKTVVAMYDRTIPNISRFVDDVERLVGGQLIKIPLEPGEQIKTPKEVARVSEYLAEQDVSEKSLAVIIGGGTLCNIAGFVATIWNGMEALIIPTNYTSMSDVAIGSLHMINAGMHKNCLQIYSDPLAVIFDPRFVSSLSKTERRNGLVETLKQAISQDASLFEQMEAHMEAGTLLDDAPVFDFALRTAILKDELLGSDPFGERSQNILLYGHVIAHAIEPASNFKVPHGEAVSLGLLGELAFYHDPSAPIFARVKILLQKLGLPTQLPTEVKSSDVIEHLTHAFTEESTLLIPRVERVGSLKEVDGSFSGAFARPDIEKVMRVLEG